MLYIYYGPDDFSIAQAINVLKRDTSDPDLLSTNTSIFHNGLINVNDLKFACETMPFLSEKRLVIVYGLLERFVVKSATARGSSARKIESQSATYETFAEIINHIPNSTTLVLIESEVKESNPLYRIIKLNASVKSFPVLNNLELQQWINQRINDEGSSISPNATKLMARIIGSNLWIMSSEIKKLATYADRKRIEEDDIKKLVGYTQEASIFNMIDAIIEFDIEKAESLTQRLLKDGVNPASLLMMLSRQMRLIVRAKELKNQKISEIEIKNRLGITHEFILRKTLVQSQRYTIPRLRQVYEHLLETEVALKTSKYDSDLALNILIAELCYAGKTLD